MSVSLLLLTWKITLLLSLGVCFVGLSRRRSPSVRHLIWLCTLVGCLILPLGSLIPATSVPSTLVIDNRVSQALLLPKKPMAGGISWLAAIWMSGAVVLLIRLAFAALHCERLIRRAEVIRRLSGCTVRVGSVPTACAWGLFGRAEILIPRSWTSWSQDQLESVLDHEKAHLDRGDCYALLACELACAIYWFHPLVWYAARRMRAEAELAADDLALARGDVSPAEYAGHLLVAVTAHREGLLLAGAGRCSSLTQRIESVLDQKRERNMLTRRTAAAAVAGVLLIAAPLAALQAERKTWKIGQDGVSAPEVIYKSEPGYTREAKDAGIEGTVRLSAIIESDGTTSNVRVVQSLDPGLDTNAVEEIESWQFKPAMKDGKPVPVSVNIEVRFRLL